jgi:hypothetical protein
VESAVAPTETATPAAPVETPDPAGAESTKEAGSGTGGGGSTPVSAPASSHLSQTSTLPSTRAASSTTHASGTAVVHSVRSQVRELNTTASTDQVGELAESVRHDTAAAAQVVDRATPDRAAPFGRVWHLVRHSLQLGSDALRAGLIDLLAPDIAKILPSQAGVAIGTRSHHAASRLPNALPTGAYLRYRATLMNPFLTQPLAEIGGVEAARLGAPNATAIGDSSPAPAVALGDSRTSSSERSVNLPTVGGEGPPPFPTLPQTAASGLGSSSFVPIVALLALLALVVPAILRRLREVPSFRAPLLFVCVLERPG